MVYGVGTTGGKTEDASRAAPTEDEWDPDASCARPTMVERAPGASCVRPTVV